MTPLQFVKILVGPQNANNENEGGLLKYILEEWKDNSCKTFRFFEYFPTQRSIDGNEADFYPLAYVYLGDGEDNDNNSTQDIVIVFATYDDSKTYQGYQDTMNAIERVREYFNKYPCLNNEAQSRFLEPVELPPFRVLKPIKWTSPEQEAVYPIFVGGIVLTVEIPSIIEIIPYI